MFYWHGFPYTNFHELNLDWIVEKLRENRDEITDVINKLNSLSPSDPVGNAGVLHVGSESGMYSSINAAIDRARQYCTPNKRVLIVVHGGIYEESVNLAPNPGIDMIGLAGAKIVAPQSTQYPNTCLYTCGTGFFSGLYFECSAPQAVYAVHYEVQGYEALIEDANNVTFNNCTFNGIGGIGAIGIGGGALDYLTFYNCRFASYNGSAVYIHNHPTRTDNNVFQSIFSDCVIEGARTFAVDDYNNGGWIMTATGNYIKGDLTYKDMSTQTVTNYIPSTAHILTYTSGNTGCTLSKAEAYYLSLPLSASLGTYRRALIPFEKGDTGNVEVILTNSNLPSDTDITVQAKKHFIEICVPDTFTQESLWGFFEIRSM